MLSEVESEVRREPEALAEFSDRHVRGLPEGSIFVGAGDSYIASLLASIISSYRCIAVEPYSLEANPGLAKDRAVVFASVSGRTLANLRAARAVRNIASRTFALTADGSSPLAEATDEALLIPYSYRPRTPGTLSFALIALAAMRLAGVEQACDFRRAGEVAEGLGNFGFAPRSVNYFLGNGPGYASSLYACAKTFEFFGFRAQAQFIEEFGHADVFALKRGDHVNLFLSEDPAGMGRRLARSLAGSAAGIALLDAKAGSRVGNAFAEMFLVQRSAIAEMKRRRFDRPYLLRAGVKLKASDSMIY